MKATNWTRPAQADLAGIDDYYAERNREYANRVGSEAIKAGDFLAEFPHAGEEVAPDHRRWRVSGTRYLLIYRVLNGSVEILRVRHDRQGSDDL